MAADNKGLEKLYYRHKKTSKSWLIVIVSNNGGGRWIRTTEG